MNEVLNGKNILDSLAGGLTSLLTQGLEGLFGPAVNRPVLGPLSCGDLAAVLCLILVFILLHGLAAWVLRRKHRQLAAQPAQRAWQSQFVKVLRRPLYLLIWICAIYLASSPLLVKVSSGESLYPLRRFIDTLFGLGMFIVVFWLCFGLTRVLEARMSAWASKTNSKLDDLVVPLLGRSLRVIIPVIAIIMALPLIGLPPAYAGFVAKASSILLIVTVAWILVQGVHLAEKAVLTKYDITAADNLQARKVYTQIHVLSKTVYVIIAIFTTASVLMLFEEVRRFGTSLLASAGVIGIIVGFAAQRTIANLFAGFQLAMTQPIRLDDVVVIEGEWGRIEEITLTYVIVKIWDERRLVVPLSEFIEKPFQNWTRVSSSLLGGVTVWVDYSLPLAEVRKAVQQFVEGSPLWDRRFWNLQVTDTNERAMQIRVLATAADSGKAWDLRCDLREKIISFIQERHPSGLPRIRAALEADGGNGADHRYPRAQTLQAP
ncbi:MAG: mechanosensitive ion channel family protein [Limisphaerales bacterium]